MFPALLLSSCEQDLKKNLESVGFKPEVRTLASFQDDYGLRPEPGDEDDEVDEEEDEEEDDEEGSEEGSEEDESDDE